MNIINHRLTN